MSLKRQIGPLVLVNLLVLSLFILVQPIPIAKADADPIYYRGPNYSTLTYPNGTVFWASKSQAVYNGSHWVPRIFQGWTGQYFQVQAGLVASRLYRDKLEYYDPNMTTLAVGRENWVVLERKGELWVPICVSFAEYFDSVNVSVLDEYINITGTYKTLKASLTVSCIFRDKLKHTVTFSPTSPGVYALAQVWNDTKYEDVQLTNASVIHRTDDVIVGKADAISVLFFNATHGFGILEDQKLAYDKFRYIMFAGGTIEYEGYSITDGVAWVFGQWSLSSGETARIDPTTSTFSASIGGTLRRNSTGNVVIPTLTDDRAGDDNSTGTAYNYRSYNRFDINSIPTGATIITSTFAVRRFNFINSSTPVSPEGFIRLHHVSDMGTTLDTDDWNLTELHTLSLLDNYTQSNGWKTADVINSVVSPFTYITFRMKSEADDYDNDYARGDYRDYDYTTESLRPQLEIVYTYAPSIDDFEAPSTVYAYQQVMLNATVRDDDGVAELQNASLTLSIDSVVLKWVTPTTFSIQDPNNRWDLVSGNRTTVNSTSYKLTWTVKAYWNATEGNVSISQAKVYDTNNQTGTNSLSNWFYNENDLVIASATVTPEATYPDEDVVFTGTILYEGTNTPPYGTTGITAKVDLNNTLKGSTTTIDADGTWSIIVRAESTTATYIYNVYATTDEPSVTNQSVSLIVMSKPPDGGFGGGSYPTPPVERPENYTWAPPPLISYEAETPTYILNYGLIGIIAIVGFTMSVGLLSHFLKVSRASLFKEKKRSHRPKSSAYQRRTKKPKRK